MRLSILLIFLHLSLVHAQANLPKKQGYLHLKSMDGKLKKINFNAILEIALDSTTITGRIQSVSKSTITVIAFANNYAHGMTEKKIEIQSIKKITNRLINKDNLSDIGGWLIAGAVVGLIFYVPSQWIIAGGNAAVYALEQMGLLAGSGLILQLPYIFKREYEIGYWQIVMT